MNVMILREKQITSVLNKVLGKTIGPMQDEVSGKFWALCKEELGDLYISLGTVNVVKSRILRWTEMWHRQRRQEIFKEFW